MEQRYTDRTLEANPPKATQLIAGINADPEIRLILNAAGIDQTMLEEGMKRLMAAISAARAAPQKVTDSDATQARQAVLKLDPVDEPLFARIWAAAQRLNRDAGEYIFAGNLKASRGVKAVHGVATCLSRLDALEDGSDKERAKKAQSDREFIGELARRGINKAYRQELAALVKAALAPAAAPALEQPAVDPEERRQALIALKEWYDDCALTARAVLTKRGQLIRLGLAHRRQPESAEETTPTTPTSPTDAD